MLCMIFLIHFGLKHGHTFIDHHDKMKRDNYSRRKQGKMIFPGAGTF